MTLHTVDINKNRKVRKQAKALYRRAFPREERLPWFLLRLNARRRGIDLTAYMQDEIFCGFTASVSVEGMHFLLFFAIDEALRGQGYGSAVLTQLRQEHEAVTLNVELLLPDAPNLIERKDRIAFYQKNGFYDTQFHVWEVGGEFLVLSTSPELDVAKYRQVFRKLSMGVWDVRLEKADS